MSSCSINRNIITKWTINHLDKKLHPLLFKLKEVAGILPIDTKNKKTTDKITFIGGSSNSVSSPESIINYHSHPISCYRQENTIWGFPSGEDMRECVVGSLNGMVAHVIMAVEGAYVCQVNPSIINNLINLKIDTDILLKDYNTEDFFRGLIIMCIEIYFRSTHAFRCYDIIMKHDVKVSDYIKFVNSFKLSNIFSAKKIKDCDTCNGIWTFEDKLKNITFEQYIKDYSEDSNMVYVCDKNGHIFRSDVSLKTVVEKGFLDVIKNIELGRENKFIKNDIFEDPLGFFRMQLFENKIKIGDKGPFTYSKLKNEQKYKIINKKYKIKFEMEEDPFFYYFDLDGECSHKDIKIVLNTDIVLFSSPDCPHCITLENKLKDVEVRKFRDVEEATEEARKYSNTPVIGVPALFYNKKEISCRAYEKHKTIQYI